MAEKITATVTMIAPRADASDSDIASQELELELPMSRDDLEAAIKANLDVESTDQVSIESIESDLPMISMETVEDIEMANDLASIAAALNDSEREAAATYWEAAVSVSEQSFEAAANVLMQAGNINQWHEYFYFEPEAGWARPLSREEKYGRTWLESAYTVPQIAYNNYDLASFGRAHADQMQLFDEGYLDTYADYPTIEDFDRGQMNDALDELTLPSDLEAWQKVTVTARSLYNGQEFTKTLPVPNYEAIDFEDQAELGGQHDYEIVEIEDGGVLARLGIDPSHRNYDMLTSLNGVVAMAAASLSANSDDYERVSALLSEFPDPSYMDAAGAIAAVEEIPFYAYDFPNMDAYDLGSMSKEEKYGRTYYAQIAGEGGQALPEGLDTYNELLGVDFKPELFAEAHDVSIGETGYYDAYSGEELDLSRYDDEEIAQSAREARESLEIYERGPILSEEIEPERMAPDVAERIAREMAEDADMGRGETNLAEEIEHDALADLNERVHQLDGAILFAEVPETTHTLGVAEVGFDLTPSTEGSYYVIYDSEKRHPYGHREGQSGPDRDDLRVIYSAVERHAPNESWVRFGLSSPVTPWGFKEDGTPYTAQEYREGTGEKSFEMLSSITGHQEGLSVDEALQLVPNAPRDQLEIPILNVISDEIIRRSHDYSRRGLMSASRDGETTVIGGVTVNGYVYRGPVAFVDRGDDVAYIANAAWEEPLTHDEEGYVRLADIDPEHVYTYDRILEERHGSRNMAERVFAQLDWQHPSSVYEEEMQLLAEDWEAADKSENMIRQPENVRLYVECKLREAGVQGDDLISAMSSRAGDVLHLLDYGEEDSVGIDAAMETLNRYAAPYAIFAESVAPGHSAGLVEVLVDTEDPNQKTVARVIYDHDARPSGPEADEDPAYDHYAEDWRVVSAAVEDRFPGRAYEPRNWEDAVPLVEALDMAQVPTVRVGGIVTANRLAGEAVAAESPAQVAESVAEDPHQYQYMMLSRLKSDIDYVLGAGGPGAVRQMWAGNIDGQIAEMRRLMGLIPESNRPEWLTEGQIDEYERRLREAVGESAPSTEKGEWRVGSIALDPSTREPLVVTGITSGGALLTGYDMEPRQPGELINVGAIPEEVAEGYRDGTVSAGEKNRAVATAMASYIAQSAQDAREAERNEPTPQEMADIVAGAEEDFGDVAAYAVAESRTETAIGNEEPKPRALNLDFARSEWYKFGRDGWELPLFSRDGEREDGLPNAAVGIERGESGLYYVFIDIDGKTIGELSPEAGFSTLDEARVAGVMALGRELDIAPDILASLAVGPVSPDPYPAAWATENGRRMTAEQMLAQFNIDPNAEYVRTFDDGRWEAFYYNPGGNEERGQMVHAQGDDLNEALSEIDPTNPMALSTVESRHPDYLGDWPDNMEYMLAFIREFREDFIMFKEDRPDLEYQTLIGRNRYHLSMRTLDEQRSDLFEDVPGRVYQMVAVSQGDRDSNEAYVADIVRENGAWNVAVSYNNGVRERTIRGIPTFDTARNEALLAFAQGGRYGWNALNGFGGFRKEFDAAREADAETTGIQRIEAVLLGEPENEWHWEIDGTRGRLVDAAGTEHITILPERKEIRHLGQPLKGATTWTADNDDVRLVLEAFAAREENLPFEPPEGTSWDGLIYDVSKTLSREDNFEQPQIDGLYESLSKSERFERDVDELFEAYETNRRFSPLDTIYISDTPEVLVSLGMEQRPVHLNALHGLSIISKRNARNPHHHGITHEVMLKLPELLSNPAVITEALDGATSRDAVVLLLNGTNDEGQPLLAVIRPNEDASYDLEAVNVNRLASVYGKRNAVNFLEAAVAQKKVLYIGEKETEELSKASQLQLLKSLAGLPFDQIIRRSAVIDKAEGRDVTEPDTPVVDVQAVLEAENQRLRAELEEARAAERQKTEELDSLSQQQLLEAEAGLPSDETIGQVEVEGKSGEPSFADRLKAAIASAFAWTVIASPTLAPQPQIPDNPIDEPAQTLVLEGPEGQGVLEARLAQALEENLPDGWVVAGLAPADKMISMEMPLQIGDEEVAGRVLAPEEKKSATESELDDLAHRMLENVTEAVVTETVETAMYEVLGYKRTRADKSMRSDYVDMFRSAYAVMGYQSKGTRGYVAVGENILVKCDKDPVVYERLVQHAGDAYFVSDTGEAVVRQQDGLRIRTGEDAEFLLDQIIEEYKNYPEPGSWGFWQEFPYVSETLREYVPEVQATPLPEGTEAEPEKPGIVSKIRSALSPQRRQENQKTTQDQSRKRNDEEAAAQTAVLAAALAAAEAGKTVAGAAAQGAKEKLTVSGFTPRTAEKAVTAMADEIEARAGAAKVKKAVPAPQQAQKRQ